MKAHKLFIVAALSGLALANCTPKVIESQVINVYDGAIIGGKEVLSSDTIAQSIVAVYDSYEGQLCTGTLVAENIVLTAAHCIGLFTDGMYIFFGPTLDDTSIPFVVDKVEVSPYWQQRRFEKKHTGDIALVHFIGKTPEGYRPAQLLTATKFRNLTARSEVVVAGYGLSDGATQDGAGTLRTTTLKIANKDFSISEVTVDQRDGKGTCHGDSGGPVYLQLGNNFYLWGVTSRGVEDTEDDCSQFAAMTQIFFHKPWINRMIQKLSTSLVSPILKL